MTGSLRRHYDAKHNARKSRIANWNGMDDPDWRHRYGLSYMVRHGEYVGKRPLSYAHMNKSNKVLTHRLERRPHYMSWHYPPESLPHSFRRKRSLAEVIR